MKNLPEFTPLKGKAIIAFTTEQTKTYNQYGRIWVEDRFNPDFHSIEEAVVVSCHPSQEYLKRGDNVLVDYGIFTAGRHRGRLAAEESRRIYANDEWQCYWCYDDHDTLNQSEIKGTLDDKGKAKAFADNVLVHPHEEMEVLIEVVQNVADFHPLPGTEWAMVYSSPVDNIEDGEMILCEAGLSPTIYFRGIKLQYINLSFIVGKVSMTESYKIKLF